MEPRMTATVLHRDGFLPATPRTCGCAKSTGPETTKHGFSARANRPSRAQVFEYGQWRGPFLPCLKAGACAPKRRRSGWRSQGVQIESATVALSHV
jgi:hypothetical protein